MIICLVDYSFEVDHYRVYCPGHSLISQDTATNLSDQNNPMSHPHHYTNAASAQAQLLQAALDNQKNIWTMRIM